MIYGGRVLRTLALDRQERELRWADEERRSRSSARAQKSAATATAPSRRVALGAAVRGLLARAARVARVEGR